jgi:hypothetical protein
MKARRNFIKMMLSILLLLSIGELNVIASEKIYTRSIGVYGPTISFKFRDIPGDILYIANFPIDRLKGNSNVGTSVYPDHLSLRHVFDDGDTMKVSFFYRVFTSVFDAEEKLMECQCMSSGAYRNALDIGKTGDIGDNCFYFYGGNITYFDDVYFIRNNVLIHVMALPYSKILSDQDQQHFYEIVKNIDQLLKDSPKVTESSQINAPIIENITIAPEGKRTEYFITLKVLAHDPNGLKLFYSYWGKAWAIHYSYDGYLYTPTPKSYGFSKTIIWVMNENYIVSAKDFFLNPR